MDEFQHVLQVLLTDKELASETGTPSVMTSLASLEAMGLSTREQLQREMSPTRSGGRNSRKSRSSSLTPSNLAVCSAPLLAHVQRALMTAEFFTMCPRAISARASKLLISPSALANRTSNGSGEMVLCLPFPRARLPRYLARLPLLVCMRCATRSVAYYTYCYIRTGILCCCFYCYISIYSLLY